MSAAEDWKAAAQTFAKAEKSHDVRVRRALNNGEFEGQTVAGARIAAQANSDQLSAAESEAKALGVILSDGAARLKALVKLLDETEEQIRRDDLHISADGKVWSTESTEGSASRRTANAAEYRQSQVDNGEIESQAALSARVAKWQRRIDDVLQRFHNADIEICLALERAQKVSSNEEPDKFNAKASANVETAKLERGEELIMKLAGGTALDTAEREELKAITNDAARQNRLSRELLERVGPNAFLKLATYIDIGRKRIGHNNADYADIEKNIARMLAKASREDPFGGKWREDFRRYGMKEYSWHDEKGWKSYDVKGYQVLATIMSKAKGYDGDFLKDLTDDMLSMEKGREKSPWLLHIKLGDESNVAHDPLDAMLGIMSKHPSVATSYLTEEKLAALNDRDWNVTKVPADTVVRTNAWKEIEASDSRSGFGAALIAASTGRDPDSSQFPSGWPKHARENVRAFERIVDYYSDFARSENRDVPPQLRPFLARAMADYPHDVRELVLNPNDKAFTTEQNGLRSPLTKNVSYLMKDAVKDPEAFLSLHASQLALTSSELENFSAKDYRQPSVPLLGTARDAGQMLGIIDGMRGEAINQKTQDAEAYNDLIRLRTYHGVGALLTIIPHAGDSFQRILDYGLNGLVGGLNDEIASQGKKERAEHFSAGRRALHDLIAEKAAAVGVAEKETRNSSNVAREIDARARSGYRDGLGEYKFLPMK
ncbi:hypothetical protein [Streptomyces alkaliterrae]|uniref:Uncharacterized protein n=1 Tax=Streptomyces alkaliterrae TaxID=2213162 RepID=A0A5P0YTF1_9ACTN|nr:hypothetical protein [Streptomyces alkaliterrae]MBB1261445.1 hypothetical protein [Streptomyces alkaliterrae]MQS03575.1 hypothetical protein [Streptomyces alkaliterrae]